jgi:hypothetical protein
MRAQQAKSWLDLKLPIDTQVCCDAQHTSHMVSCGV